MIDWGLAIKGIRECKDIQGVSNYLKIDTVFVSPMRRALQTAFFIFRTHPDFEKINFVVCPYIREVLGVTWDIPTNTIDILKEFSSKFNNFDISLLRPYKFKLDFRGTLSEVAVPSLPKMIYSEMNGRFSIGPLSININSVIVGEHRVDLNKHTDKEVMDYLYKKIKKTLPHGVESSTRVRNRVKKARKLVCQRLSELNSEDSSFGENPEEPNEKPKVGFLLNYFLTCEQGYFNLWIFPQVNVLCNN